MRERIILTEAKQWLAMRSEGVPDVLTDRMRQALDGVAGQPEETLAECFRNAARRLLEEYAGDGSWRDAITLLAADAFVTCACEAVAERKPGRLAELR